MSSRWCLVASPKGVGESVSSLPTIFSQQLPTPVAEWVSHSGNCRGFECGKGCVWAEMWQGLGKTRREAAQKVRQYFLVLLWCTPSLPTPGKDGRNYCPYASGHLFLERVASELPVGLVEASVELQAGHLLPLPNTPTFLLQVFILRLLPGKLPSVRISTWKLTSHEKPSLNSLWLFFKQSFCCFLIFHF